MRIRELRLEQNMAQKELAEAVGIARNTLSQYETGKREPDVGTLKAIAAALRVSVDELLGAPPAPISDAQLKFALFGDTDEIDEQDMQDVRRYAQFVRDRKKEGET